MLRALGTSLLLLAVPASAQAGTVAVDGPRVRFTAADLEVNGVAVVAAPGGVDVSDAGAPITPGPGCVALSAGTARCAVAGVPPAVEVLAGDEADVVVVGLSDAFAISVLGGAGDDDLRATSAADLQGQDGNDVLRGSGQDDDLLGGLGDDLLLGGAGDDDLLGDGVRAGAEVVEGGVGDDVLTGGEGRDSVTYAGRTDPVDVDLAVDSADQGTTGERDRLAQVEDVTGGEAADRLLGNGGANALDGGAGKDVVAGRSGADVLTGEDASGGAGPDQLVATGPIRTSCGSGADVVGDGLTARPTRVALGRDCETVQVTEDLLLVARPVRRGTTLRFTAAAFAPVTTRFSLGVRRSATTPRLGTLAARRAFTPGVAAALDVPLTTAGRRLAAPLPSLVVSFTADGATTTFTVAAQ